MAEAVQTGQRWTIERDGMVLAEGVIARVRDGYVTVWPVTTDGFTMPGCHRIDDETVCWPGLETGMDNRMLGRHVGDPFPCDADVEDVWRDYLDWSDTNPTLPAGPTPAQSEWIAENLALWEDICFSWSTPDDLPQADFTKES